MNQNRFFTLETESRNVFIQIPKIFAIEGSKYFNMSMEAKYLYGILADRNKLSIKNGWIDEQQRVFFLYSQAEIGKMIGKDVKTVRKYLKQLEDFGLLHRERQGLNKTDRLYLLQVETSESLCYQLMGKISPSKREKKSHQESSNFPTNNNDLNNNKINNNNINQSILDNNENNSISSTKEDEGLIDSKTKEGRISLIAEQHGFNISKDEASNLLYLADEKDIIANILKAKATGNYIANPFQYILTMITNKNNQVQPRAVTSTEEVNPKSFNNFQGREYDYDSLEKKLLGW